MPTARMALPYEDAARILEFIDNENVCVEMVFDGGERLFESQAAAWTWPDTLAQDAFSTVQTDDGGQSRTVYKVYIKFKISLKQFLGQE